MSASASNTKLDPLGEKTLDRENLAREMADSLRDDFQKNSKYNMGAEVEDLVFKEGDNRFEPLDNKGAEKLLEDIHEYSDIETDLETESIDGKNVVKALKVEDSPFPALDEENPFYAEIDNDLNPRQSEVATDIVTNPADLTFRIEYLRRLRGEHLDEHSAYEAALSPETMFEDLDGDFDLETYVKNNVDEAGRRPGKRYEALDQSHGKQFNIMGSPAATQLNTGLPVGEEYTLDELVFFLENGGSEPSLSDVAQAESSPFNADPVVKKKDGEYESVIESGREMLYDLFIAESEAADRKDVDERWGDVLEEALPSNNNYGSLKTTNDAWVAEDIVEATMATPGIMSTDISPSDVYLEETGETVEEYVDGDETWVVFDNNRMDKDLGGALEDGEYTAKFLLDGELVDAHVKHSFADKYDPESQSEGQMTSDDYFNLAKGYVQMHSTFVRPDLALKMDGNGIIEGRNYSNSPRTNQALLDQKGLFMKLPEVQEQYANELSGENAENFRDDVNRNGLDSDFLEESLRELQRENVNVKAEGLKGAFPEEQLPYTFEVVAEEYDSGSEQNFRSYLEESFSDFEDFLDYQIEQYGESSGEQGELDAGDWSQEYAEFQNWFVETAYTEPMNEYLDEPTVNQQLVDEANHTNSEEAYKQLKRE